MNGILQYQGEAIVGLFILCSVGACVAALKKRWPLFRALGTIACARSWKKSRKLWRTSAPVIAKTLAEGRRPHERGQLGEPPHSRSSTSSANRSLFSTRPSAL